MIEDKEMGLKVAESDLEALWGRFVTGRKDSIKQLEDSLIIEKELLKLGEAKLKEVENESKRTSKKKESK